MAKRTQAELIAIIEERRDVLRALMLSDGCLADTAFRLAKSESWLVQWLADRAYTQAGAHLVGDEARGEAHG